jgi:hypothetical protein
MHGVVSGGQQGRFKGGSSRGGNPGALLSTHVNGAQTILS